MNHPNSDGKLAFCDACGHLLTLVDMREQAASRGQPYPDRDDSYVIVCDTCNYVDRISDPDLYYRVVAAIKATRPQSSDTTQE